MPAACIGMRTAHDRACRLAAQAGRGISCALHAYSLGLSLSFAKPKVSLLSCCCTTQLGLVLAAWASTGQAASCTILVEGLNMRQLDSNLGLGLSAEDQLAVLLTAGLGPPAVAPLPAAVHARGTVCNNCAGRDRESTACCKHKALNITSHSAACHPVIALGLLVRRNACWHEQAGMLA